jgi:hypothetical protein
VKIWVLIGKTDLHDGQILESISVNKGIIFLSFAHIGQTK